MGTTDTTEATPKKATKKAAATPTQAPVTEPFDANTFIEATAKGEDLPAFNEQEMLAHSKGLQALVNVANPLPTRLANKVKSNAFGSYALLGLQGLLVGTVGYLGVKEFNRDSGEPSLVEELVEGADI